MVDGGVVTGYLVAFLLRGATQFADKKLEDLLERLYATLKAKLSNEPALAQIEKEPKNSAAQAWLKQSIEVSASRDASLNAVLLELQNALRFHAPDLAIHAPGAETVVGVNSGYVVRGTLIVNNNQTSNDDDLRTTPGYIKSLMAVAAILCVSGLVMFTMSFLDQMNVPLKEQLHSPNFGRVPTGVTTGMKLFMVGFVVGIAANVARLFHRKKVST